jgi:predicted transglutaminase-like cysteine proteinase
MLVSNRVPVTVAGLNQTIDAWRSLAARMVNMPVPISSLIWAKINDLKHASKDDALAKVNVYVNGLLLYDDKDVLSDYWATPTETLAKSAGDCVEYAVLKMWILERIGFDKDDLDLWLCHIRGTMTDHATLLVHGTQVLDSLSDGVHSKAELDPYYQSKCLIGTAGYYSFPPEPSDPPV